MDQTSTPQFHVGYDNGYGHPGRAAEGSVADASAGGAAPAHPSFAHTVSLPAEELAAALTDHDDATGAGAPAPARSASPWVLRSVVLGGLAFVVLLGAVAVLLVGRSGATNLAATASSTAKGKAASTPGTRLDEHGDLIADSITFLPPTTAGPDVPSTVAPTTPGTAVVITVTPTAPPATAPVTAPVTTAPTVPPTTAAPTTSTTAPTTTSTTAPVVKITTFTHPSSVSCANPADQVPYIPLSWSTQNAVKVTVSIDGPGIYKTYMGTSGNDTVPFSCPGPHTYLITAYSASNQVATQQVVISKS